MYSSLFRELHASRLQLDLTSAEGREMTAGPDANVSNDVTRDEEDAVCDRHAMFESPPELLDDHWLTSFNNVMMPCASAFGMPESRDLFGSYYESGLLNATPGGALLSRFMIGDDIMFDIPSVISGLEQTEMAGLTMTAAVMPAAAFDMTSIISSQQMQQQQQRQHQQSSLIDAQRPCLATVPSSLFGYAVVADASGVVTVPSSTPSSSPSAMSASGAGGTVGCGESSEDATAAAADDDTGSSSSSRGASSNCRSPHSGIFSNRCEEGASPPTSGPAPGAEPLDHSPPPGVDPSRLLQGCVALDHRRGSLELGCAGRDLVNGTGHLSQAGVAAAAAADVPANLRRASIPCMSVSASRGLARAAVAASHLGQRPSAPLDYESLKVKLEKLTGTVTDGKRAKETPATDRSRRTSLVSLTHPPSGSSAMTPHPEVDRLTPTLTSSATTLVGDAGFHPSPRNNGFAASYVVAEVVDEERGSHLHPIISFQPLEPTDAITQDAKTAKHPAEDFSSTSSSPSPSSSSSSLSWDKFRLQCIIENVLQYDVRLQEILKRHEMEMAEIKQRHRFQWMVLEQWLTQRFGDQWKKFIAIPALSSQLESVSTSPWRYPAPVVVHSGEVVDKTGQRDEICCSVCSQNVFDPLGTIKEGQFDEDQLDSNAAKICPQPTTTTTTTTMHNTLQHCIRLVTDASKLSTNVTDHAVRRCSYDGCVDSPQRPRATSLTNILVGEKAPNADSTGSRICQNIASSLARRQSSVAIMNPNSSRLHRHTAPKEIASTRTDPPAPKRPNPSAAIRSDPSGSIRPDSAAFTRPDPSVSTRPDLSASSRPPTPQGDYRQLLLLAQALQSQTNNSCLAQFLLPNVLPTFHAPALQTTNFAASYGCDPALLTALNGGVLPVERGAENGVDLNGIRPAQQAHCVEAAPPQWASGSIGVPQTSLQATGEEASRAFPSGQAQPQNGYPGLPQEVPGSGCLVQTLQGYPFTGLLPSNPVAPCQMQSVTFNPWLMNVTGASGDGPRPFVTPSSSSLGFPYTMVAPNQAFFSLLKDYGELM